MAQSWQEANEWERQWHGNCVHSYHEETKQIYYAKRMGLVPVVRGGCAPCFDLHGASVLDVGGGPYSLLLKCFNFSKAVVVDPCPFPEWVTARYHAAGIQHIRMKAENYWPSEVYDEAWLYNVLQHSDSPGSITNMMIKNARLLRVYEWIETGTSNGHIHSFTADWYDKAFDARGYTETAEGTSSRAWFGLFAGDPEEVR